LPSGLVHTVCTSPPYYSLRSYEGQQTIDWSAMSYHPMPGLPPLEIPAMTAPLGLEQSTKYQETVYQLREDLSSEEFVYVISELAKHGAI
jgi:hypothetical protein